MTRWTPELDQCLKDLVLDGLSGRQVAECMGLSPHAIRARARRLHVRFRYLQARPLQRFLARGGRLLREYPGGAIPIRWTPASRSGSDFPSDLCERLLSAGRICAVSGHSNLFQCFQSPDPR